MAKHRRVLKTSVKLVSTEFERSRSVPYQCDIFIINRENVFKCSQY